MGNACSRVRTNNPHDHERRFLEDMIEVYKVDGDLNKKELTEIQSCVEQRLWKACERLKGTDLEVVDIVLCGSMAECTRVWEYEPIVLKDESSRRYPGRILAIEFDYLAVLKTPACKYKDQTCRTKRVVNGKCKGHKVIMDNTGASHTHLQPDVIRHDMRTQILKKPNEDRIESRLVYRRVRTYSDHDPRIKYEFLYTPCDLYKRSTTTPSLNFKRHNRCLVNVDLMPAFMYTKLNEEGPRYLVATSNCSHKECFLKSYCREEILVLKEASQIHRDVYILLKSFNMCTPSHWAPSYYLKTAVLRHIETCDEPDLVGCHRKIIQYLDMSYEKGELITFRGEINLLAERYQSTGEELFFSVIRTFLDEVFGKESAEYSFKDYDKLLKKSIHEFMDTLVRTSNTARKHVASASYEARNSLYEAWAANDETSA